MRSFAVIIVLCVLFATPPAAAQNYTGRTNASGFFEQGEGSIEFLQPTRLSTRNAQKGPGLDTITTGEATIAIEGVVRDPSGVQRVFVNGEAAVLSDSGKGTFFTSTLPVTTRGDLVEVRAVGKNGNQQVHRFVVRRLFKGQQWAVVIGVSEYQDSDVPRLRYAHEDAIAFYKHLTSPLQEGGAGIPRANAKLLVNGEATATKVRSALTDFLKMPTEDDIVYVYYAGHGVPDPDRPEVLFFLAYDTDRRLLGSTAIPMKELQTSLQMYVRARTVLVFVDACHGSGVTDAYAARGMASPQQVDDFLKGLAEARPSTMTFAASDVNQLSQEDRKWGGGHGVFTYYLLEALKGAADLNKDNIVRLGEMVQFVSDRVRRDTHSQQSPISSGVYDVALPLTVVPGK
jgi:hypothetical protein